LYPLSSPECTQRLLANTWGSSKAPTICAVGVSVTLPCAAPVCGSASSSLFWFPHAPPGTARFLHCRRVHCTTRAESHFLVGSPSLVRSSRFRGLVAVAQTLLKLSCRKNDARSSSAESVATRHRVSPPRARRCVPCNSLSARSPHFPSCPSPPQKAAAH